jgi:hypothetical protein
MGGTAGGCRAGGEEGGSGEGEEGEGDMRMIVYSSFTAWSCGFYDTISLSVGLSLYVLRWCLYSLILDVEDMY